jgi:hypothetical protein
LNKEEEEEEEEEGSERRYAIWRWLDFRTE